MFDDFFQVCACMSLCEFMFVIREREKNILSLTLKCLSTCASYNTKTTTVKSTTKQQQ
jgi:hypothetical protein